jgi:pilus assembly protein CpaE
MTSQDQRAVPENRGRNGDVVALVPRINIHAFCSNPATAQAMQAAAIDRRLARAHLDIQFGGVMAAVQVYGETHTPNVLVVETEGGRDTVLAELTHLANVCDPSTKVIVIGHVNDVVLYRELIRSGVSEYLVAPLGPLHLIEAIGALYANPKAGQLGRILAFVGAKGGVGSSTIAHNVGWLFSRKLLIDTVITDLDLAFGTAGLNFNIDAAQGIAEALGQPERVDQTLLDRLLAKAGDRLSLLSAPGSIDRDCAIDKEALEHILDVVRISVPNVIVDVPNLWAPWTKATLVQADDVVVTATPELASLRNTKNLIDVLKAARPNDRPPRLVLNQVGVPKRPEIPVGDFARSVGTEPAVVIPFEPQIFGTASSNGQMIAEVSAKSKPAELIEAFALDLAGRSAAPAKTARRSILPFLGRKSSLRKK